MGRGFRRLCDFYECRNIDRNYRGRGDRATLVHPPRRDLESKRK